MIYFILKIQNCTSQQKMSQKQHLKKKKVSSSTTLAFKISQKSDKISLKFAVNMLVPSKPAGLFNSAKSNSSLTNYKLATSTPKRTPSKKSSKQNGYMSAFVSNQHSYLSTPFQCEEVEPKSKCRNDFKFLYQVGAGGFGRVWKVQEKKSGQIYAMKEISKAKVLVKKSVSSVINEKSILQLINNPFIINMKSSFQDREYLYMTMEYLRGGDLRYHLCYYQFFNEQQAKFIAACIVLALQYSHSKGIIHRDLKPENLVFQEDGYIRVTDFGVARKKKESNSEETSGTPGYMAPQVICRMNHSFQADYFALGVIMYEIMMGLRPYTGESRKQIRDKILAHQAKISQKQLPNGWSFESMNFINSLLKRNKESRLGYNGIEEIKNHQWFSNINWRKLGRKEIIPPYVPGVVTESLDYQKEMENTSPSQANEESEMLLRTIEVQNLFKDYSEVKKLKKQPRF